MTNNCPEFNEVYLPRLSSDFLMNSLVETNKPVFFNKLKHLDFPGKREFLEETQKIRPVSDACYLPIHINKSLVGFSAIGRAGINSPDFSKNDIEIFSFITDFITEGLKKDLYIKTDENDKALINGLGQVVTAGPRIKSAFIELFGDLYHENPGNGLSSYSYKFYSHLNKFMSPVKHPGSGNLWLFKNNHTYHLNFQIIKSPHYRKYLENEPQVQVSLAKDNDFPEKNELLDYKILEKTYQLTTRETEIIQKIYRGLSNKEISVQLKIAEATVKRHIWNIFNKTGVENRTQLVYQLSS